MCIMEVLPGQHSSTIAQACAHNAGTVIGDLEMFLPLLRKRIAAGPHGDVERERNITGAVEYAHGLLREAYAVLLTVFGEEVSGEVRDSGDGHGHERSFTEQAHHDAMMARRYMTR